MKAFAAPLPDSHAGLLKFPQNWAECWQVEHTCGVTYFGSTAMSERAHGCKRADFMSARQTWQKWTRRPDFSQELCQLEPPFVYLGKHIPGHETFWMRWPKVFARWTAASDKYLPLLLVCKRGVARPSDMCKPIRASCPESRPLCTNNMFTSV